MADILLNGNTYSGVNSVRFENPTNTGFVTFYGEPPQDNLSTIIGGGDLGDMTFTNSVATCSFLTRRTGGTISFPNAETVVAETSGASLTNLLFPSATLIGKAGTSWTIFRGITVTGVLDLSAVEAVTGTTLNQTFAGTQATPTTIGTLLLGKIPKTNGLFTYATITNLVWNNPNLTASDMGGNNGLNSAAAITNAYVPDSLYDDIAAMISGGTLTKVTNLYRISEWQGVSQA